MLKLNTLYRRGLKITDLCVMLQKNKSKVLLESKYLQMIIEQYWFKNRRIYFGVVTIPSLSYTVLATLYFCFFLGGQSGNTETALPKTKLIL